VTGTTSSGTRSQRSARIGQVPSTEAGAAVRIGSSAVTRRVRRSGQMAKTAATPTIAPPIQIHTTTG
jgi:hypothetical protein